MPRTKFVKQLKTFKITAQLQNLVTELQQSGFFATEAEVYRQGIVLVHNYYLKNPAQESQVFIKEHGKKKSI